MPLLHWLTRDDDIKTATHVPYRLLEEDAQFSHGDRDTGNMLIQGDNLDALKALLPYYAGKVKCIFIDPPYNTRSAFEHYDDNLEHTQWLALIYPRLELLRSLLAEDGSIWVSIDDNEAHYLKVVMDEVFGRKGFVASNVWQKRYSRENREAIGDVHEYIFVYAKNPWRSPEVTHFCSPELTRCRRLPQGMEGDERSSTAPAAFGPVRTDPEHLLPWLPA